MPKTAQDRGLIALSLALLVAFAACRGERTAEGPAAEVVPPPPKPEAAAAVSPADPHSFGRPDQVAVKHLQLDLTVDFAASRLSGKATLDLDNKTGAKELILDTRDLDVARVTLDTGAEARFAHGDEVRYLGRP
jgi:hypothetical protein